MVFCNIFHLHNFIICTFYGETLIANYISLENLKMYLKYINRKRLLLLNFNIRSARNLQFCPNTGKYGYNSVRILGNTDQRKPTCQHISRSVLLNISSHNLDLLENISFFSFRKLFVHKYINCLAA